MEEKVVILNSTESLQEINNAELQKQIEVAHQFPRDEVQSIDKIARLATASLKTAESCYYALPKTKADGTKYYITGESVRFAEIIAHCWKNLRVGTRIVKDNGKIITAQGYIHDLESNLQVAVEAQRNIAYKDGNTFPNYLVIQIGMAASSIAFRNVIFKAVPKIMLDGVRERIKQVIVGKDIEATRKKAVEHFTSQGVPLKQILKVLTKEGEEEKKSIEDINEEDIFILRAIVTGIEDKEYTLEEAFGIKEKIKQNGKRGGMGKMMSTLGDNEED